MKSKTFGDVSYKQMVNIINEFINADKYCDYAISIGTDSQNHSLTKIAIVVAVHRVGRGGIFFYDIKYVPRITNVRQKIYYETALSLELASNLSQSFAEQNIQQDIEIHADVGTNKSGKTYELISEIVGWVTGAGYNCKIKPFSTTASCIADRISK